MELKSFELFFTIPFSHFFSGKGFPWEINEYFRNSTCFFWSMFAVNIVSVRKDVREKLSEILCVPSNGGEVYFSENLLKKMHNIAGKFYLRH